VKIAVVAKNGKIIIRHVGRTPYDQVITIEDGKIVQRAMRPKPGHNQFAYVRY
jgi:predicted Fe-Mo cluster-binding NifX family protein